MANIMSLLFEQAGLAAYIIPLVSLWLIWDIWTFKVRPYFYTHELDVLPYRIPFIGHAISLFKNTASLYSYADTYFGHSCEPYILHVAGQQLVVVTRLRQQTEIFRNNDAYSFDPFINVVYHNVGKVSATDLTILWRKPSEGFISLHPNPKQKPLVHTGVDLLHKQVVSSDPFQELVVKVGEMMEQNTQWQAFTQSSVIHHTTDGLTKVVSLHRWCRDITIGSQTCCFFGPYFAELEPNFTDIYDQWDINSWMATYQYPGFMAKAATEPREKLVKALMSYLDAPREKRTGGVAYVNEVEAEMRQAGLGTEACARILMIILWGINSNVQMTTFWMMVHILSDSSLISALRSEIAPKMVSLAKGKDVSSESLRTYLDQCPLLNSLFNEIVRFYNTGSSMRETARPIHLGNKIVPKGSRIVLPKRHLLLDPAVFGEDANVVNPYRFIQNKALEKHEYYHPFGQGITRCSGKIIGRFEVLSFVAWTLWRYEFVVIPETQKAVDGTQGMAMPRIDFGKPSLGISKQVEGDDLVIQIQKRGVIVN
ncbi:cytochrome P450 [Xylaria intraflava]|nr:cytochrome P450 [Xylaria intraflava]